MVKQITDAGCAHAHEHFYEFTSTDGEERHSGFPGNCPGQQSLAGSGRTHQQNAFGDSGPQALELFTVFKELDYLVEFLFSFLYSGYILVVVLQLAIYRTRWGLRLRAAGENPKAAGTIGIDVLKIRYRSLAAGGAIAGFAGAYLVVVATGSFVIGMSSGIGFIGIAAMIFGRWNPVGVAGSALVFGFALATGSRLATVGVDIPTVFLNILPYVVTILVVAGLVGRVRGPAAVGQPYEQG